MSTLRTGRVVAVWLAGSFLWTSPLLGQEPSPAEQLFEQGRQELNRGDYEAACMHLRESDELDPAPGTALNLGECESLRGRLVTAWTLFSRVEHELSSNDIRMPIARQKREALELRLGRLSIHFTGTVANGIRVRLQSRRFELRELREAILVEPGEVQVTVMEPGKPDRVYPVSIVAGTAAVLNVDLSPPKLAEALPSSTPSAMAAPDSRRVGVGGVTTATSPLPANASILGLRPRATSASKPTSPGYGYVLLGSGVVVAALGGILGLLTLDAKRTNEEHCDELLHTCDATGRSAAHRGRLFGALTTAAWVTGGVGIALGSYSLVTSPRRTGSTWFVRIGKEQAEVTAQYRY